MATFTWTPRYISNKSDEPRIKATDFGDGYSQRAGDGLNTIRQVWDLEFVSDSTTITAIETFLETYGTYGSFDWTPPRQTTALKFRYITKNRSFLGSDTDSLQCTFRQEFDLT